MMRNKLRQVTQKSPKDFWNYVNSLNKKPSSFGIRLERIFDFFKNINSTERYDVDDSWEQLGVPNFNSDALNIGVIDRGYLLF